MIEGRRARRRDIPEILPHTIRIVEDDDREVEGQIPLPPLPPPPPPRLVVGRASTSIRLSSSRKDRPIDLYPRGRLPEGKGMEKYEVVRDIGSGNSGVARLMRNKETKELVAMKYIPRGEKVRSLALFRCHLLVGFGRSERSTIVFLVS